MNQELRNPGPSFGYPLMRMMDRLVPEILFRPMRAIGTWFAVAAMPAQRRHSRAYLAAVLGRPPRLLDVFRHFFAFTEFLMLKLRIVNGRPQRTRLAPNNGGWLEFMESGRPALLGSLHLGHSDLLGFLFSHRYRRRVFMVRRRVGNSHDTDKLLERFGDWLRIIWVNDASNLLFELKAAVDSGGSIAMKCDRFEFAARTATFDFLGSRWRFPITIYHLAIIFQLPVVHVFGLPGTDGESVVHSSPVWRPDPHRSKSGNLASAQDHFQAFLHQVESVLREQPYQWFNFTPLDAAVSPVKLFRTARFAFLYYASWFMFGAGGLLLNLVMAPLLLAPRRERFGPAARRAIRTMFGLWLKWLHACGVVEVRWRGFGDAPLTARTVFVANHPTLVDATFLLARLPDAVCIFKPALLRNPAIAPAALLAGYLAGDRGVDTIRSAAEAVRAGRSLLIFPEGTRTAPGTSLNPLKPGFALIARRAGAPVQVFRLEASPNLAARGRAWWRLPELPGWIEIARDELILPEEQPSTAQLVSRVGQRLKTMDVAR